MCVIRHSRSISLHCATCRHLRGDEKTIASSFFVYCFVVRQILIVWRATIRLFLIRTTYYTQTPGRHLRCQLRSEYFTNRAEFFTRGTTNEYLEPRGGQGNCSADKCSWEPQIWRKHHRHAMIPRVTHHSPSIHSTKAHIDYMNIQASCMYVHTLITLELPSLTRAQAFSFAHYQYNQMGLHEAGPMRE